jgi:probable F420-dependent oxidoreductase
MSHSVVKGGPVDELLDVAVERPGLDQLEVEVGRVSETGSSPVWPVMTGKSVTWTRSTRPAAISARFIERLRGRRCQDGGMEIGEIGIWTSYRPFGRERAGEAAKLAEALGYGAWWVGGSPHVPDVRPILEATSSLVAATGILNVWTDDPGDAAAADAALRADFPGRFLLGIGIGHPEATSDYRRPLKTMREFLDGLDASPAPPPVDGRCLAALGPKMLDLAGARTAGTHPYFTPVDHTRFARERLGPDALVAPELACVVDTDAVRAKAVARDYAKYYLSLRNYTKNLLEFGFTEDDLAHGGSDRLIDAVIPQGSAEQIAEVVRAHLDAGADHVCLQPLGEEGIPRRSWTALADALSMS